MTIDEFEPLVGEWMLADCVPEPVKIRLIEATPLKDQERTERPPFILIFFTPPHIQLIDGAYAMRCGAFGPDIVSILSMTPPPNADDGFYYQAVFN